MADSIKHVVHVVNGGILTSEIVKDRRTSFRFKPFWSLISLVNVSREMGHRLLGNSTNLIIEFTPTKRNDENQQVLRQFVLYSIPKLQALLKQGLFHSRSD